MDAPLFDKYGRLPNKENLVIGLDVKNDPCDDEMPKHTFYILTVYNKNKVDKVDCECVYYDDGYDLAELFKTLRKTRYRVALDNLEEALAKSKE